MLDRQAISQRVAMRQIARGQVYRQNDKGITPTTELLALITIAESVDDFIECRLESDKTLEGILKDIEGGLAQINLREELKWTFQNGKNQADKGQDGEG